MRKALTIILLITSNLLFSQEIIRPASAYYSANLVKNRTDITRAIMDGVKMWKDSGFVEMEIPLYQPMLKMRMPKIEVIDTLTFRAGSETTYERDSTQITWWFPVVTKMLAIKTLGDMQLEPIGIPFYPKFKQVIDITSNSVKLRSILSEQCEVLSIKINGVDYPTAQGFNATKISEEEYRHTRLAEGLTSNTIYMANVQYKSEIGEIIEVGFTFKTLP